MKIKKVKRIIISRTDAIGDVMLTLPMAGVLKKEFPEAEILFFGKTYTHPVISCCSAVDGFINYDEFEKSDEKGRVEMLRKVNADVIIHVYPRKQIATAAKDAGIPVRIGTRNRIYHWTTCNKLVRLSRKKSGLHESVLNLILLKPLGVQNIYSKEEILPFYFFDNIPALDPANRELFTAGKIHLIVHPRSHGSAREWNLENFRELIRRLPEDKFRIFITGGPKEKDELEFRLRDLPPHVKNVAGVFTLSQLIAFIAHCDGIVAASTGPLHIAAALNKFALGLYPPIQPMDPSRWAPLGKSAFSMVVEKKCDECRLIPEDCHCINEILPDRVTAKVLQFFSQEQKGKG